MKVPPKWKVQRELVRLRRQMQNRVYRVTDIIMRKHWVRVRPQRMVPVEGDVPFRGDVAIFLIFQPDGCPDSLFQSLRYLVSEGFAPLVVSNQPISDKDLVTLRKLSWKIVTRPNFGYDFGGYKDGVWLLDHIGVRPESLLFVNDTIWFPIGNGLGIFERLREFDAPYLGITDAYNFDKGKRIDMDWGQLHVTSFFFWIRKSMLTSRAFSDWWNAYVYSSEKRRVVRDGEVGFFKAMNKAGFSHRCIVEKKDLLASVDALPDAELSDFKERLSLIPSMFHAPLHAASANHDTMAVRAVLHDVVRVTNPSDCLAYEGICRFRFPFLKKTILKNKRVRDHFLDHMARDGTPMDPVIIKEMKDLRY